MTPLETKMNYTIDKLAGYMCCSPCYKHINWALKRLDTQTEVNEVYQLLKEHKQVDKLKFDVERIFFQNQKSGDILK